MRKTVYDILLDKMPPEKPETLAGRLTEGKWTHDYPVTCAELTEMELPVCGDLSREIYDVMDYYPQPVQRSQSAQYIPVPYRRRERKP